MRKINKNEDSFLPELVDFRFGESLSREAIRKDLITIYV